MTPQLMFNPHTKVFDVTLACGCYLQMSQQFADSFPNQWADVAEGFMAEVESRHIAQHRHPIHPVPHWPRKLTIKFTAVAEPRRLTSAEGGPHYMMHEREHPLPYVNQPITWEVCDA